MSSEIAPHDDWNDRPQGELLRMVKRLNAKERRSRAKRLFGAATLCTLLVAAGVVSVGSLVDQRGNLYGGITCEECRSHLAAYHDHVKEVALIADDALAESMKRHLADCHLCRSQFDQTYPGVLSAAPRPALRQVMPMFAVSQHVMR